MNKRLRKFAAVVLASALLLQNGTMVLAEEGQTQESQSEPVTEKPTEAQTQTEKQTEPQTEPQTQAPTEPQTQAPTETQTQAPAETETQASSGTETQEKGQTGTEKSSEKKESSEKETEKQTERSERENSGEKLSMQGLTSRLQQALSYLFAAESVSAPSGLLEGQAVADGQDGSAILAALKEYSVSLANAKSSSQVRVINLYADKNGALDTAQLDALYKDHVIDVTNQYCVVNVIADSADQALSFSGYAMKLSGAEVNYKEGTEPGDILYNFAAMDGKGEKFVAYKGELSLGSSGRLQGAFLAPDASVTVRAELAGAVYAKSVTVADYVTKVLQISFAVGREPVEETGNESETSGGSESGTSGESETGTSDESESGTSGESETGTSDESESGTSGGSETGTSDESESGTSGESETGTSDESESGTSDESESETGTVTPAETENDAPTVISVDGVQLDVQLVDAVSDAPVEGNVYVMEAEALPEENAGEPAQQPAAEANGEEAGGEEADGELVAEVSTTGEAAPVGEELEHSGVYYLTAEALTENYEVVPRHYFTVSQEGEVEFAGEETGWDPGNNRLTLSMSLLGEPSPIAEGGWTGKITVEVTAKYNGVNLYALENSADNLPYIALYKVGTTGAPAGATGGEYTYDLVSDTAKPLKFDVDSNSATIVYDFHDITGLEERKTYALQLSDKNGNALHDPVEGKVYPKLAPISFGLGSGSSSSDLSVPFVLDYGALAADSPSSDDPFPEGFYYPVNIQLTKSLLDVEGNPKTSSEVFYADIFTDEKYTQQAAYTVGTTGTEGSTTGTPKTIAFDMHDSTTNAGSSEKTVVVTLKANKSSMAFYVAETDKDGEVIEEGVTEKSGYMFKQTGLQGTDATVTLGTVTQEPTADGSIVVKCDSTVVSNKLITAAITNQLKPAVVELAAVGEEDQFLSGVRLVIKAKVGKGKTERWVVQEVAGKKIIDSDKMYIAFDGVFPDGEYYLSEIEAPKGYAPAEDVPFTVKEGITTTVQLSHKKVEATSYSLKAEKQVYCGQYQLYARDDTPATHFHVALFKDSGHKVKVSDVQEIHVKGMTGSTTFSNLTHNGVYYLAETDEYGEALSSGDSYTIRYANDGRVPMDAHTKTGVVQNIYTEKPKGYRYSATLTIGKRVTNAAGAALPVTDTFYVGIYRNADYSDSPTVIRLDLNNKSSAYVRRRILLDNSVTYYFAEVDANGNRINSSSFGYNVSIDQPSVTLARGEDKTVTVTNQEKSSKVTLYLTTRVYRGTMLQPVTETFYAGLFRDPQFKELYTQPIPMNLQNRSELTLKLSLNLGTADKATIYIAEVDRNGNVIRNEQRFGYEIRVVNSTAVFTRETREIQTIFLNSVYGSASDDDWQQILADESNIPSYGGGGWGSGWVGGNGEIDPTVDTNAAQTGDETPIGLYVGLLAAAAVVVILLLILRFRKKKRD